MEGDVTTNIHVGQSWVWGRGLSDVVYMAMKNYHTIACNGVFESPSASKFIAITF